MRKSLWIVLVLVVLGGAPAAHADSLTYTFSDPSFGISWATAAIPAVTMPTAVPAADLTAKSATGFFAGCTISGVELEAGGVGDLTTNFTGCGAGSFTTGNFPLLDFSTPGTYLSSGLKLVVAPAVAAPEPSSAALMLLGIGLMFVMRKRMGHPARPQAT